MGQTKILPVIVLFTFMVCSTYSYDLVFNTDKDVTQWSFNGSYIYSRKIPSLAALLPLSVAQSSKENDVFRVGVWMARYIGPDEDNYFTLQYRLKAHLFKQGFVHFIASPDVPVIVTTNDNQEVGKFWSDGKSWCDAVFSVNLHNQISISMSVPSSGNYVLIDRIIMGVMANLQLDNKGLNPCLTSPPNTDSLTKDDMAPDMAHKPLPPRNSTRHEDHTPPDMINKPASGHSHHHLRGSSGGAPPPDMVAKTQVPNLDTSTVTTSNDSEAETQTTDSSDVKCGCSCSCSRVKGRRNNGNIGNNATMVPAG